MRVFFEASKEIGISAAFGALGGAFAHTVAVKNPQSALRKGIRRGYFRSDLGGNKFDFVSTNCGREVLRI